MIKFKPLNNPLLIVSDNPSLSGGLSRMCRDLATLCCTLPQFGVAVLGRGMGQRRKIPCMVYDFPESMQWGEDCIQHAWEDWAGEDSGVIITLDDASRRHWFVNPSGLPGYMQKFLGSGRNFQRWMYLPLDSTGPNGKSLSVSATDCVNRYDRVAAASEWGRNVLVDSGRKDADWLPHGIFTNIFYPRSDQVVDWKDTDICVGSVMANQSRKDFPALFECFLALKMEYGNRFHAWLHTDVMIQYWNVYALAADYGVSDCLEVTTNLPDEQLALRYSACDCTVLPTAGEGFGYPIAESLACGTACITTDYAGGAELVQEDCRVPPVTYRVDTQHNCRRAVISGLSFANLAKREIERKRADWEYVSEELAQTVAHLNWTKLRTLWERWMLSGLKLS